MLPLPQTVQDFHSSQNLKQMLHSAVETPINIDQRSHKSLERIITIRVVFVDEAKMGIVDVDVDDDVANMGIGMLKTLCLHR